MCRGRRWCLECGRRGKESSPGLILSYEQRWCGIPFLCRIQLTLPISICVICTPPGQCNLFLLTRPNRILTLILYFLYSQTQRLLHFPLPSSYIRYVANLTCHQIHHVTQHPRMNVPPLSIDIRPQPLLHFPRCVRRVARASLVMQVIESTLPSAHTPSTRSVACERADINAVDQTLQI